MIKSFVRSATFLALVGIGLAGADARAAFVGSFGINGNMPSVSPTSGLAGATTFTIASMATNGNATGGFAGLPTTTAFTGGAFTLGSAMGFSFSNTTYGTFTQTNAAVVLAMGMTSGVVTSESFYILGSFSGGPVGTATPASFTVSFTQTGGPGTSISASGTVNIPPVGTVPEPASVIMLGMGIVGAGVAARRRMVS